MLKNDFVPNYLYNLTHHRYGKDRWVTPLVDTIQYYVREIYTNWLFFVSQTANSWVCRHYLRCGGGRGGFWVWIPRRRAESYLQKFAMYANLSRRCGTVPIFQIQVQENWLAEDVQLMIREHYGMNQSTHLRLLVDKLQFYVRPVCRRSVMQ